MAEPTTPATSTPDPTAGTAPSGAGAEGAPETPLSSAPSGEGSPGPVDPSASPQAGASSPPAPNLAPAEDWRDKRIAQLTAKLREAQAKPAAPTDPAPGSATLAEAEINRRASVLAAQQAFVAKVQEADSVGRSAYQDFDARVGAVKALVNQYDPAEVSAYNQLLGVALETGEAPRLLYELGSDRARAAELLALANTNPAKLAIEMAKMALVKGDPVPSGAPRPISPITPKGASHTEIDPTDPIRADKLSTAEWMKRREAQARAGAGRR